MKSPESLLKGLVNNRRQRLIASAFLSAGSLLGYVGHEFITGRIGNTLIPEPQKSTDAAPLPQGGTPSQIAFDRELRAVTPTEEDSNHPAWMQGVEIINPQLQGENYTWDTEGNYILDGKEVVGLNLTLHSTNKHYQNEGLKIISIKAAQGDVFYLIDNQDQAIHGFIFSKNGSINLNLPSNSARFGFRVYRNDFTAPVKLSFGKRELSKEDKFALAVIDIAEAIEKEPTRFTPVLRTTTDLSKEFGITTQTVADIAKALNQDYNAYVSENYPKAYLHPGNPPNEWSEKQTQLLGTYLEVLPPHFFAPDKSGKPLIVTNLGGLRTDRTCATATCSEAGEEAVFAARQKGELSPLQQYHIQVTLDPEAPLPIISMGLEALAHEAAHRLNNEQIRKSDNMIAEIFGERFTITSDRYSTKIEEIKRDTANTKEVIDKSGIDTLFFLDTINYGLTTNRVLPHEFVPTMAQHYLHGRKVFTEMYGLVFPAQIVEQLYKFTKDEVYKGAEYQQFPQLEYPNNLK